MLRRGSMLISLCLIPHRDDDDVTIFMNEPSANSEPYCWNFFIRGSNLIVSVLGSWGWLCGRRAGKVLAWIRVEKSLTGRHRKLVFFMRIVSSIVRLLKGLLCAFESFNNFGMFTIVVSDEKFVNEKPRNVINHQGSMNGLISLNGLSKAKVPPAEC